MSVHAGNVRIGLGQQGEVIVDGRAPATLPVTVRGVTVRRATTTTVIGELSH